MTAVELIEKYISFFEKRGHKRIANSPLIPENDPTVLFTTAGMHPLVLYLLGEPHPLGKRLVGLQKCLRTDDIDEIGDAFHHTFFEMLGNWSLGDYWKKEAIEWSFEFLTKELRLNKERLFVTCFVGDKDAPRDEESAKIWQSLGIPKERIFFYGKKDNWWGPAGETGPCGPDTEMFYDLTQTPCSPNCQPNDNCGRFSEIWNDVFMQYEKTKEGKFKELAQKNVDTGMGVERILAVVNGKIDNYQSELFLPIIQRIEKEPGEEYSKNFVAFRIIADHLKASAFLIREGIIPSNKLQGYVLRRLLRRAATKAFLINKQKSDSKFFKSLILSIAGIYPGYFNEKEIPKIEEVASLEIRKFRATLERGLQQLEKSIRDKSNLGLTTFNLFQSYGYPPELTIELLKEHGIKFGDDDMRQFDLAKKGHAELSRNASAGMFKGGLADHSEIVIKYHTATHLLHASLRHVLGNHVSQKGSNITSERVRFDFSYDKNLTEEELKKVEGLVNEKIKENLPVTFEIMNKEEALKSGALGFFKERYEDKVKVYSISDFSKEICGGPHVDFTGRLKSFKIIKQENIGGGNRRIYAKIG